MSRTMLAAVAALLAAVAGLLAAVRRAVRRERRIGDVVMAVPQSLTSLDDATGAVRSLQSADVTLPPDALARIWTPEYLERLARTYWRFLARATLGLVHVSYSEHERAIVLLGRPFTLLAFQAPEYEMDASHGLVRWRIARGLLVTRRGRDGGGYLQIEVRRNDTPPGSAARLHVNVEVANFYPAIASRLGRRIYDETQSRIHVVVTKSFLRSLVRLDFAESHVGRYRA
jgi:hypothetical protein